MSKRIKMPLTVRGRQHQHQWGRGRDYNLGLDLKHVRFEL